MQWHPRKKFNLGLSLVAFRPGHEAQHKVFISYAHENDGLRASIKDLADWLGERGCQVFTDHQFAHRPPEKGWTAWMQNCIEEADVVLVVCTPKLKERYSKDAPPGIGRGATFEGAIVTQHIYDNAMRNTKFFPIAPDDGEYEDVPTTLRNWWNNHRFPSGHEGIRNMIFDDPNGSKNGASSHSGTIAVEPRLSKLSQHEELTVKLLGKPGAQGLLGALKEELGGEFELDRVPEGPEDFVRAFSPPSKDQEQVYKLFNIVHRSLRKLDDLSGIDREDRRSSEEAAAALYCLAAGYLVDSVSRADGDFILRVPMTEPVIYAVITTAVFGGELRLVPAEQSDLPTSGCIYEVTLPAGGHEVEGEFERAAYLALFQNDRDAPTISLGEGRLDIDKREELYARLDNLREVDRSSFAFVVQGLSDSRPLQSFAEEHQAPILIPDDAAARLLRIEPARLRAKMKLFWAECRELGSAKSTKAIQPQPSQPKGSAAMSFPNITIKASDDATVAVTTGKHSPAEVRRREGMDSETIVQVLQELIGAIKAEPAGDVRDALIPDVERAKEELEKPKLDAAQVKKALDAADETIKKGAGVLQNGEKIAGLVHRAYQYLSSLS